MAKKIARRLMNCTNCEEYTIHYRTEERTNWKFHAIISVLTVGVWLVYLLLKYFFQRKTDELDIEEQTYLCSICDDFDETSIQSIDDQFLGMQAPQSKSRENV